MINFKNIELKKILQEVSLYQKKKQIKNLR